MQKFLNTAKRFIKSEDGPTATEYAVMLSLIIVACIATISLLGAEINTMFTSVQTTLAAQ
ncbi:MAG: Flp family type IVb pilin [Planctomycetes bacterium]|nr:Flp family type IVb pilin [Planctomycetota bacterium]